jgi:hypothetical protein
VELVVLRGIAQSSDQSGALYEWASGVVEQACYDRRDVRVCSVLPAFFKSCSLLSNSQTMMVQWCKLAGMQVHIMPEYGG